MSPGNRRLVIISNRLPVSIQKRRKELKVVPSTGGLVNALSPILRRQGGLWLGWPGIPAQPRIAAILREASREGGYSLVPVQLDPRLVDQYYYGFANEVLWPLFHDQVDRCNFKPGYWVAYREANRRFARAAGRAARPGDFIWVHDYHLVHVGYELREAGCPLRIGFFLHTPFPSVDIFRKLPWAEDLLDGLLEYDLVGFQTPRDRRNFLQCVRRLAREVAVVSRGSRTVLRRGRRTVRVGSFPIGIDTEGYMREAESKPAVEQAEYLKAQLPGRELMISVDRLDYTKGIPQRLEAFRNALARYPDLHRKVTFIQVVVPSRSRIPEYQALKTQIEQMVGEINGRFTAPGWVPIHHLFRTLRRHELIGLYRAARIGLISPLKDGMNLVAKEYCACSVDEDGVLILSEFAGAAEQLRRGALLVNPYDIEGVTRAIHRAFVMPAEERRRRMRHLRAVVRREDVFAWVDAFLGAAAEEPEAEPWFPGRQALPDPDYPSHRMRSR